MLHINNLSFRYGNSTLFHAFHAQLTQAGLYGLFGRNGSGKSTLLKILSGLLTPDAGTVEVLGYTPRKRNPKFLEQVYILPEEFHLPNLTPAALRQTHADFYPNFNTAAFDEYLEVLQVPIAQSFEAMSLGQKKKATIAFALATQTPLLLMDEPTNGLDIVSRSQFRSLITRPEHANRTILISTHQAHDLETILNHIWFIDAGKLVLSSSLDDLSQYLHMGIAVQAADVPANAIYHEAIGQQTVWVAPRTNQEASPVQLELLYKTLSLHKDAVMAALNQTPENSA